MARELAAAQNDVESAPVRRRKAVMQAHDELRWTKYRIAAALGVKGPTVDAIIRTGKREQKEAAGG